MGWARVALMSRCGSGAARQQQPQNPSRSCRRTTSEANPSEQSCILYSDMLSQRMLPAPSTFPSPLLIRSPCPAVPFPAPAICIYSEEAAAASAKKNENFFHLFEGFPATRTHPPTSCTSLFIYVHIFLSCRRRKDFFFCETHTATGELDALLGSARETEKELRQRTREGVSGDGGVGRGRRRWNCV